MARKRRNEVLVGAFLTAGMVLFVLLLFLMGSLDFLFSRQVVVAVDFADVQSLQEGDPVYVFGMKVGRVVSVDLLPYDESRESAVRVELKLPAECRKHLREDTTVRIDKSLTGTISVLIQGGSEAPLGEGQVLRGTPSVDFSVVTERADQVLRETERLVQAISAIVEEIETRGSLVQAISEAETLVKDVREELRPIRDQGKEILGSLQELIDENRLDIRHTVANLRQGTEAGKEFIDQIQGTPRQLEATLQDIEKAGTAVAGVLDENRTHIDTILQDLREAATSASNLIAELKRRPWRLWYYPSDEEIEAMNLYDAAWAYNLGATELNRSVRDLADLLKRKAPDGTEEEQAATQELLENAREEVRASLKRYRKAEETFWEKLRTAE